MSAVGRIGNSSGWLRSEVPLEASDGGTDVGSEGGVGGEGSGEGVEGGEGGKGGADGGEGGRAGGGGGRGGGSSGGGMAVAAQTNPAADHQNGARGYSLRELPQTAARCWPADSVQQDGRALSAALRPAARAAAPRGPLRAPTHGRQAGSLRQRSPGKL